MRYRDFLGRKTSVLCLGTVGLGFDFSQKQSNEILDAYVELGGNFLDTARIYGDFAGGVCGISERAVCASMSTSTFTGWSHPLTLIFRLSFPVIFFCCATSIP